MLPNVMSQARSRAAAAMGRARTPAKIAAARKNAAKATRARLRDQTPEERSEQAKAAAAARWAKRHR
jgi:ribosomal protein L29